MQRREGIRCYFRSCRGDFSEQCRLTRVRITDQACIRYRSQLEQEMPLLALLALSVLARRAITGAFEMHISLSPCPAMTKHKFLPVARKIDNRFIFDFRLSIVDLFCLLIER